MRRSLVEVLTNPDHDDALRGFLQAWHGVELPTVEATPQVPAVLGSLLALRQPERITYFNRAFEPEVVADGLLLFASEYEGVYHWAYRPGEPDPIVWGWFPDWKDPQAPWPPEQERHRHSRLGEFLVELCVFNAIFSSPKVELHTTSREALPEDLGPLGPVLGTWHWPEYPGRFLVSDRGLGFVHPSRGGHDELTLLLTEYDLTHHSPTS